MYKQFLEAVLPSQGNYCIFTLMDGKPKTRFAENGSIENAVKFIEAFKQEPLTNIYFALSSFDGFSRKADDSIYIKSFFLDLDVGKEKNSYATKDEAYTALDKFIEALNLPCPVVVDSGNGLHVYWILKEAVETSVWKPYAEKFKKLCHQHKLVIDPAVPADAARVLRVPFTKNYCKDGTVKDVVLINDELYTYDFDEIVGCFGEVTISESKKDALDLKNTRKKLTDKDKQLLGLDRYEHSFEVIANSSIEGTGCAQIKFILEEAPSCSEPLWRAGLSVAIRCADGADAIHKLSEDYPDYVSTETENKAEETLAADWAYGCEAFEGLRPEGCEGCPYKGKIIGPIDLGKRLRVAQPKIDAPADTTESKEVEVEVEVEVDTFPKEFLVFSSDLHPFFRLPTGGIRANKIVVDKKTGEITQGSEFEVYPYDVIPFRRMVSPFDGECMFIRINLPKDKPRNVVLPSKLLGSTDKLREFMFSKGVVVTDPMFNLFKEYLMKWNNFLIRYKKAEELRFQLGFIRDKTAFVVGDTEVTPNGIFECPTAPSLNNLNRYMHKKGSYDEWKKAANRLGEPSWEYHALGLFAGFGSPLMGLGVSGAKGCLISYCGGAGAGKTAAMCAGLSLFGQPDKLYIGPEGAAKEGLNTRCGSLNNLLMGMDETSNMPPDKVSDFIYKISNNNAGKIRHSTSADGERYQSEGARLICIMTTNQSNISKLYENKKANPEGELRRIIEFDIQKYRGFLSTLEGRSMFAPFDQHYGHAGPDYIANIYKYGFPYVAERIEAWEAKMHQDIKTRFSVVADDAKIDHWMAGLCRCFAGAEMANTFGILNFDFKHVYDFIIDKIGEQINRNAVEKIEYEELIHQYVLTNLNSLLTVNDGKIGVEPRSGTVAIRCEVHTNRVFLMAQPFKEYLTERKISLPQFERELTEKGILIQKSVRKRLAADWKDATSAFNARAYEFKLGSLSELLNDAPEGQDSIV
jgi:hypothetical protein